MRRTSEVKEDLKQENFIPPEPEKNDMYTWFRWLRKASEAEQNRDLLIIDMMSILNKNFRRWTDVRKNSFPSPRVKPIKTEKQSFNYPPSVEHLPKYNNHTFDFTRPEPTRKS